MPKIVTPKSAVEITTLIDRIASLLERDHEPLRIPPDVAMDQAYRLDLISDHIMKVAANFDAKTIGEKKKGPLHVEDKGDDMPGEWTQEEFFSVEEEARSRQTPLPKSARRRAQQMTVDPGDYMPGEWTQEEFRSMRDVARPGPTGYPVSDIHELETQMPADDMGYDDDVEVDVVVEIDDDMPYGYTDEMNACARYASRRARKGRERPRRRSRVGRRGSELEGRRRAARDENLYEIAEV